MPIPRKKMIPSEDAKDSYQRTSLTMTRSMSEDIGLMAKKILEEIDNQTVNLTYVQWKEFISYCWNDEIWIMAMNKAIDQCKEKDINLNTNKEFLKIISGMTLSELKNEFRKTHPIARLALMDLVDKKPPKPIPRRVYADLWLTRKELNKKYKEYEEET